jgi:hypothetical protein
MRIKPENLQPEPLEPHSLWAALACHGGAAASVAELVALAPARLGPPALAATLRPGLAHLARPLIGLTVGFAGGGAAGGAPSEPCEQVAAALLAPRGGGRPSAWEELALDDGAASAAAADELLARCGASLRATVHDLLLAALRRIDRPSVALRLATMHWHGDIEAAPLLAADAAGGGDGGGGGGLGGLRRPGRSGRSRGPAGRGCLCSGRLPEYLQGGDCGGPFCPFGGGRCARGHGGLSRTPRAGGARDHRSGARG